MRHPDWFKAQVVEAVLLHGLTYAKAAIQYGVSDDAVKRWVHATADTPAGLDRLEVLEHRVARIEHYLSMAAAIREQTQEEQPRRRSGRRNGHHNIETTEDLIGAVTVSAGIGRVNGS